MPDTSGRGGGTTGRARKGQPYRGALSALLLVVAVCALALGGFETASGRWHATPVLSGSMRPGLQPGDVVITQRVPISDLHVRDVIVFHPPNEGQRQTVHRIVKLRVRNGTTVITTRGDANTIDDPTVTSLSGSSAYRVVRVVPLVGYPAVWLSGGHHGPLVIGLGILLLIGSAVVLLRPDAPRHELPLDELEDGTGKVAAPSMPEVDAESSTMGRHLLAVGTAPATGHTETSGAAQGAHEHTP